MSSLCAAYPHLLLCTVCPLSSRPRPGRPFAFQVVLSTSLARSARRESIVVACALRSPRARGGEESLQHCVVRPSLRRARGEREKANQLSLGEGREKVASLVSQWRQTDGGRTDGRTDGPLCTTATRNSSRRASERASLSFEECALPPSRPLLRPPPLPLSLCLSLSRHSTPPRAGGMVPRKAGPPCCRNGRSRGSLGGKIECCCWACWSARSECWGGCAANFLHG